MDFSKVKSAIAFTAAVIAAPALAQNVLTNGDMSYGDGGWYLWNNPDGPAKVEQQIGVMGLGVDGSEGAKVVVKELPKIWWGLQLQPPKWLADSAYYTLTFKAKGNMPINAVVQGGPPDYRQKESGSFQLTDKWQTFSMTFLADQKGYGLNNVTFHVGLQKGWMQIDDVEIEKSDAMDTAWYNAAESRIDSLRKKDFTVKAKPGSKVSVKLKRHAFPFGTALNITTGDKRDSVENWYKAEARKFFWHAVSENQFKWPEYEPKKGKIKKEEMYRYVYFTQEYGWKLRGHALMWGHQGYGFDKHYSNPEKPKHCKDFEKYLKARIERDLKEYKGKITEYDVWNEPLHESYTFNTCGWGVLDSAFIWAHRADPDAKLYINEYNVVAAGETDRYVSLIKGMLDRKVPVHGIGVQCHFGLRPVVPGLIKERLDKLAKLGLPIKVTEFDVGDWQVGMNDSEEVQAEKFETFIRTAFSHPAINGIVLWGFWDNRHWVKNGGIVAADGREKPAAKRVYDLWHKVWTTETTAVAGEDGVAHFRGFKGRYQVTADGKTYDMDVK
ncbi:MAG: endo-1,4-beta-xylanase [Fibrobacter sp.]|uniref:endo-1,4-beta-xylanase n=1 Tax=Fibrobacter sp. TaxID=35828 RepID=UPI0025C523F1|nr:endo-1,4-beta-xylanase [Fibrobacter sp.]MBR4783774.1 endo-1,4-beta-xylanase [Fibrobacter sp.]